eukprot:5238935-Prymnesium_polylepis.1
MSALKRCEACHRCPPIFPNGRVRTNSRAREPSRRADIDQRKLPILALLDAKIEAPAPERSWARFAHASVHGLSAARLLWGACRRRSPRGLTTASTLEAHTLRRTTGRRGRRTGRHSRTR